MSKPETYASVWDAIADTPEQAANPRAGAELMQKIAALLKQNAWTQAEAANRCGVRQPRINDLLHSRVSQMSTPASRAIRRASPAFRFLLPCTGTEMTFRSPGFE